MSIAFKNENSQQKGKFPLKLGAGAFFNASNFEPILMNVAEVNRSAKKIVKERIERNGFSRFKNEVTVKCIRGEYWSLSHAVI